jgi:hypothetical protein
MMSSQRTLLKPALVMALIASWGLADGAHQHEHPAEHRQHGAHVHGLAILNLALDGQQIRIELHSPAANIVGFEHAPASAVHHAALDQAVARLQDGEMP